MAFYAKIVDAMQILAEGDHDTTPIIEWMDHLGIQWESDRDERILIRTIEGRSKDTDVWEQGRPGNWIVKESNGSIKIMGNGKFSEEYAPLPGSPKIS